MSDKNIILIVFVSLLLVYSMVKIIIYLNYDKIKEGLTDFEKYSRMVIPYPENATINYNDINSPQYSHTVNLPINDPISCKNFCGPNAKCLITGEQCTSDIDCYGCTPVSKAQNGCTTKDVKPYDASGKLGQNMGLQYSPLTTGYNNHSANFAQIYENSKEAELTMPYGGKDLWTKSFNKGLQLYNEKIKSSEKNSEGNTNAIPLASKTGENLLEYQPKYPMKVSLTGQFYETTPPASNSSG